jgi:hypothetical protein
MITERKIVSISSLHEETDAEYNEIYFLVSIKITGTYFSLRFPEFSSYFVSLSPSEFDAKFNQKFLI